MEEQPDPPNNHHFSNTKFLHTLFTSMFIIALSIIFLYFLPSQPPQFINHNPSFSKLWELIHLLFIGIALCYGFFVRRKTRTEPILDIDDRYLSGFSQISSFFDYGFEGVNGYDENLMVEYIRNGLKNQSLSEEERFISETKNFDYGYLNGESVGREKCGLNHLEKSKKVDYCNPLNLPVRSLRSKAVKNCYNVSVEEIGNDLGSVRFCDENDKSEKSEIRGLIPINLEKKFEEAVAFPSPVPWGSRLSRVEVREKFKPLSHTGLSPLGGFELEKLNSKSVINTMKVVGNRGDGELDENLCQRTSFSHLRALPAKELDLTKAESKSKYVKVRDEKRKAKSPLCLRASSVGEFGNNEKKLETIMGLMETRGKEGDVKTLSQSDSFWSAIYSPISPPNKSSHITPIVTEVRNPKLEELRNGDITLKTYNKSVREENREKMDTAAPKKYITRGKSVRTTKRKESCLVDMKREKNYSALVDEISEKTKAHNLQNVSLDERSKSYEYHNDKRQMSCRSSKGGKAQTEKEYFGNIKNFKVGSGEEADSAIADNEELDSEEVDKKADAFIAKFREQIRLQKIDSIKRKR